MLFNKKGVGYALPNFSTAGGVVPHPLSVQAQIRGNQAVPKIAGQMQGIAAVPRNFNATGSYLKARGVNRSIIVPGPYFEVIGRR